MLITPIKNKINLLSFRKSGKHNQNSNKISSNSKSDSSSLSTNYTQKSFTSNSDKKNVLPYLSNEITNKNANTAIKRTFTEKEKSEIIKITDIIDDQSLQRLKKILSPDIDINSSIDDDDLTILHYIARVGWIEGYEYLNKNFDLNINAQSKHYTPLDIAAYNDEPQIIEVFLKRDDIDFGSIDPAKEIAIKEGHKNVLKVFEQFINPLNLTKEEIHKRFESLINRGSHKSALEMLEKILLLDIEDSEFMKKFESTRNYKLIDKAFEYKNQVKLEKIKGLLANPQTREIGIAQIKDFIESRDFNPTVSDLIGNNTLHIVSAIPDDSSKEMIQKLINKGIDINSKNAEQQNSLISAIKAFITSKDDVEKNSLLSNIKFLLDKGINIDEQDKLGQTAFHYVCFTTSVALFTLFLSKSPNIFLKDIKGNRAVKYLKTDEMKKIYENYVKI